MKMRGTDFSPHHPPFQVDERGSRKALPRAVLVLDAEVQ